MMGINGIIAGTIIALIILLIWSRVMDQSMLDTLSEIKEFIGGFFEK